MDRSQVRRGATGLLTALAVALTGCSEDSPTGTGGGGGGGGVTPVMTTSVTVGDNFFSPEAIQVGPGVTVTWTWSGSNPHNVNFSSASIMDSSNQTSGMFSAAMPSTPGTYNYQCTIHPGMNGSVLVM